MTNYGVMRSILVDQGMDLKVSATFVDKLREDEENFRVSNEQRLYALKHGFFPGRIELYGLTENNRNYYLPDYQYFMMHPYNHHFKIWINDKLTLKYVLNTE